MGLPICLVADEQVGAPQFLPIIEGTLAQQVVGAGGYVYWNRTIYAELSLYSHSVIHILMLRAREIQEPLTFNELDAALVNFGRIAFTFAIWAGA
jgi:hypothetical protein